MLLLTYFYILKYDFVLFAVVIGDKLNFCIYNIYGQPRLFRPTGKGSYCLTYKYILVTKGWLVQMVHAWFPLSEDSDLSLEHGEIPIGRASSTKLWMFLARTTFYINRRYLWSKQKIKCIWFVGRCWHLVKCWIMVRCLNF